MAFSPYSDLYFVQPVLSGHLAIPRGRLLNTGLTVFIFITARIRDCLEPVS